MTDVDEKQQLYPQSLTVLDALKAIIISVAAASRTPMPHVGRSFMQ